MSSRRSWTGAPAESVPVNIGAAGPAAVGCRLAIAQPLMHWTGQANTQNIVNSIAQAAAAGAQLCLFPELALTGFHREIAREARAPQVAALLQQVQAACAQHQVAVAVGAPTFDEQGGIYNSHLFFDASGQLVGVVAKHGLTDPEATFFARGQTRPVVPLLGWRCTAVICREVEDGASVVAQLQGFAPELVLWPGLMGPEAGHEHITPPRHVQQAQALAQRLGAWLVQSNWPMHLNYPELNHKTGASVVISPAGQIMLTLPQAQAGLAVFDWGQPHFDWLPAQPAA